MWYWTYSECPAVYSFMFINEVLGNSDSIMKISKNLFLKFIWIKTGILNQKGLRPNVTNRAKTRVSVCLSVRQSELSLKLFWPIFFSHRTLYQHSRRFFKWEKTLCFKVGMLILLNALKAEVLSSSHYILKKVYVLRSDLL